MWKRSGGLFTGVGIFLALALAGCASGEISEGRADAGPGRERPDDASVRDTGNGEFDAGGSDAAADTTPAPDTGTADVATDTAVADAPDSGDATDTTDGSACRPEDVAPCDDANPNLCLETSCDGVNWYCTQADGSWGWRTSPACSDAELCTQRDVCLEGVCGGLAYSCSPDICPPDRCAGADFIDVATSCDRSCDGAGGCEACACEESSKRCGTGSGNVCCEAVCDPVSGCSTRAGSCGVDQCADPNLLRLAGSCTGCGTEGGCRSLRRRANPQM